MNNAEPGFWRGLLNLLKSPISLAIIIFFVAIYVIVTIMNVMADNRAEKESRRQEELREKREHDKRDSK